ncbi:MAG: hypothetical protein IJO74_06840 [Clostridia bacterium]|nr:hypothetical protein [Clostridia bacterium]
MIKKLNIIYFSRFFAVISIMILSFALVGCDNKTYPENGTVNNELYLEALAILDELNEDPRIKDFRNAYDLLMTLPGDEDKFISQLHEINAIFQKYGVELQSGDYYLLPKHTIGIDREGVDDYRFKGAYYDADDLMSVTVYPALFEKYGDQAQCIKGITAPEVISAVKSGGNYYLDKKTEQYNGCKEEWKYTGTPKTGYEIKYHSNGLVESVSVPIVRSDNPLNDDDYIAFFDKDAETQKQIAGSRFMSMSNQFTTIATGYEVLSQIFTDEEITVISNYIHSLTIDDIWERNLYALVEEPTDYFGSIVSLDYKGNSIGIHYNLNDISLNITGKNYVNPLAHRWYTVYCGMGLPEGEGKENTLNIYSDFVNNNTDYNNIIQDYSYDLDANADKFAVTTDTVTDNVNNNVSDIENNPQQSIPVEMSMSDEITVYGVIQRNDTGFPAYRLKLTPKLTLIFDEYKDEKVFECEYLYFYDDAELNGYFPFGDFVDYSCEVTALLEDYRGGDEIFLLNPTITNVFSQK